MHKIRRVKKKAKMYFIYRKKQYVENVMYLYTT